MRGKQQSAFANPVLVGAVTVLATLIAVFLAYNANQGLPFVPTRQLKVDMADAQNVIEGNDVRIGGYRIGLISKMKPVSLHDRQGRPTGQTGAELTMQLAKQNGNVPVNSRVEVLPRSVLGTKYVALIRGTSKTDFADGATMNQDQTARNVQVDEVFGMFDSRTRTAIQSNLRGYGDTFTGRGSDLNDTISLLPSLLPRLERVAGSLSAPSTGLTRFINSLENFMGAVAPVAQVNARLFTDMATTFEAISRDPNALQATIAQSPPTLDVSTDSLRVQQPFLVDLTTFGNDLAPGTASLKAALPVINPAIEQGTAVLARTPVLNEKLQQVMNALKKLSQDPATIVALNALTSTVRTLNPMIRYLGPYVTVCNNWNYWWTYLSEHISEQTTYGFAQRALLNFANQQPNSFGQAGATQPMNGYTGLPPGAPQPADAEFVHGPTYGSAIDNRGNADCEVGQRGYVQKLNSLDPKQRNFHTDQHSPGNQGPTWTGRNHVPKGETFSRNPQTGPQTPPGPANNP